MSRPQHQKVVRLRLASAALGLGAVIAISGCSAGQVTQTDTQVAAVNGASGDAKDISIRDAQFPFPSEHPYYPKGSSASVSLVMANAGNMADRLVGASSPYAASVDLGGTTTLAAASAVHAYGDKEQAQSAGAPTDQREIEITLRDLNREIGPGVTVPVTFVFEKSGSTTVQVPIGADPSPRSEHGSHAGAH